MKPPNHICTLGALTALVMAGTALAGESGVSIGSLLNEMIDRDAVARFPETDFRLRQQSSYDRLSRTPDDPKGWFANKDNTKNFIRVEENDGRKEWVLMEDDGPGAIVRTWMPFRSQSNPNSNARIRIYLDGSTEPVLEGNKLGMFNGTGLIPFPLAHMSLRSAVSFFPIPYAKGCKVTVTEAPFFFQFTYREYPDGTPVNTFTMDDFKAAASLTDRVGKTLLAPQSTGAGETISLAAMLAGKTEKSVDLPAGPAAVRALSVKLGSYEDASFGKSLQLDMEVWSWTDCEMGYGVGVYWYGDAATSSNRKPDPEGALAVPPLPDLSASATAEASSFKDAVECESMKVVSEADNMVIKQQSLKPYKGTWSATRHLFVRESRLRDVLTLWFPTTGQGPAKLVLHATKSYDYGVLRFTVNGQAAGAETDLYAGKPAPSGPIALGEFAPVDGAFLLQAEVVGRNPKSEGTFFGLDCVQVTPVRKP